MKNTINKIILFAAVLFAAGVSQNAAAVGYYIEIPSRTAVYTAVDYDNEADAISAAEQLCRAGEGASAGNRCFATATRAAFTNMLIVHTTEGFGVGENFNAAYTDLIDRCEDPGAALDRMTCEDIFPSNNLIVCGDGTAADFADDNCGERNPDVSICGTGTTGNGGRVNSDCVCTDSTHNLITDTTTNTQTCEPIPPTCDTTTTELNTGTNMCDCRTGFSGRVSPTMCERNAADCTGATPVLFNGICVAACQPDEARNSAGVCEPNPANCGANAITNPDDDTNCICIDDMHRFVAGSTTECEPIPAMCGANAINNPNDNTMCVCENAETHRFVDGSTTICELISEDNMEETEMENEMGNEMETEMEESQNPQLQPQNIGSGRPKEFAYIGAGVFIIGFAASYIAGGGFPIFNYSPDFGYSLTESGYSANIGGRADFRKDNWHLYYSANQTNANGEFADFRYTSGGRYNGDLFAATFSESVAGETANYNFSLSADVDRSLIVFSPVYRLHSEYDKGEFSTRNELNLQSNFHYDGWTINSSAGFRWENTKDFAENARFQINAIHRF